MKQFAQTIWEVLEAGQGETLAGVREGERAQLRVRMGVKGDKG